MGIKRPRGGYCPGCELVSDSVQPVRIVDVDGNVDETRHPLRFRSSRGELAVGASPRYGKLAFAALSGLLMMMPAASLHSFSIPVVFTSQSPELAGTPVLIVPATVCVRAGRHGGRAGHQLPQSIKITQDPASSISEPKAWNTKDLSGICANLRICLLSADGHRW